MSSTVVCDFLPLEFYAESPARRRRVRVQIYLSVDTLRFVCWQRDSDNQSWRALDGSDFVSALPTDSPLEAVFVLASQILAALNTINHQTMLARLSLLSHADALSLYRSLVAGPPNDSGIPRGALDVLLGS